MGGMVLETNMNEIVAQVEVQNRLEKSEVSGWGGERLGPCRWLGPITGNVQWPVRKLQLKYLSEES